MRQARIRGEGLSYYHCLSRVVDRQFILGDEEREHFVVLMRKLAAFLGLRVVTYAVMSNHFHLLVEEPDRSDLPPLDRETLLRRLGYLYDPFTVETVRQELDRAAAGGDGQWERRILERYQRRMGDVSIFMKELKQRFSSRYNRRSGRRGTLWEERYKSLLVEGDEKALMAVAAYIDLNSYRAGMVDRVEDYRWCGYASAVAGNRWAKTGLGRILRNSQHVSGEDFEENWKATAPIYRLWLYDQGEVRELSGEESPESRELATRRGFTPEEVEAERARGGKLPLKRVIHLRVRYFIDGGALGSAAFVEKVFERHRGRFGPRRETGARRMREADWEGLCVLRDLKCDRIGWRSERGIGGERRGNGSGPIQADRQEAMGGAQFGASAGWLCVVIFDLLESAAAEKGVRKWRLSHGTPQGGVREAPENARSISIALAINLSLPFHSQLQQIVDSNEASSAEVDEFFEKSKEILKIHDKIMSIEPPKTKTETVQP